MLGWSSCAFTELMARERETLRLRESHSQPETWLKPERLYISSGKIGTRPAGECTWAKREGFTCPVSQSAPLSQVACPALEHSEQEAGGSAGVSGGAADLYAEV